VAQRHKTACVVCGAPYLDDINCSLLFYRLYFSDFIDHGLMQAVI